MLDQLVMGYASQMSGQKAAFVTLNHIQTIDCNMRRAKAACGHPVRHGWRRQALLPDPGPCHSQIIYCTSRQAKAAWWILGSNES
ncbi:hypothetical protein [Aeromonas rivipollensis]|uniref:hypothetical protein n=1 Tax=Aeromonas rivipollensis TaxID=948519 RepID=UPI003CFF2876